ncbi:hypothetical protein UF72_2662 [Staphylococcus equorum subsp. equorum]|nr:hypothetical protein UF72_2662 [Staphylococcus equorum subsp. equorum]
MAHGGFISNVPLLILFGFVYAISLQASTHLKHVSAQF